VGMYDFGARHIAEAIETVGRKRGFKTFTLTLQPGQSVGKGTKADDLTDKEVVEELQDALGKKFKNAWVKIGLVNGWVASSYHIKVAVRDKSAFWLSSGNWQSSNQPDADPLKKPWDRSWLSKYNREWHAIVEHAGLAADYEKYLLHDFRNNVKVGSEEALVLPDILLPDEVFMPSAAERAVPFKYFEPFSDTRVFDVQPLLTPDNYHEHALALINSAQEELLIQNQTFNAPKPDHKQLRELLSAVLSKQKAGVKVRIIFRIIMKADARKNLEALQEFGFDMDNIKVQKNCHTKGIIVDRQRIMLGSQNLSEQGVSLNRDASLVFEDPKLAAYFAEIFDHDWNSLASDSIDTVPSGAELATSAEATMTGFTKISAEEYLETL
jgi:phosphatidylserine/phosphatidylglycerophosphate/cardiolipin synthase-like enzyme